jgi:23S rRNA G2069 N7-methylase RlmK/C1962 C5-methylase RlmI
MYAAYIVSEDILAAQGEMLCNRVKKNLKRLRKWSKREGVTCYRIYDRDIPEIPLVIDWYEGRLHVAEFQRKHASEDCGGESWMKTVLALTALELAVQAGDIYYKVRGRQRGQTQYQARGTEHNRLEVSEAGHRFLVNLVDYLDTGLFLDHRRTRSMVAAECQDKSLLNLFCYTGSFSVYAGVAGASNTLGVDLSATYLEWARANLTLNGLDAARNRLRRGDVADVLKDLAHTGERFDIAVVDPPTFSNSKRMDGVFDVQRDHVQLLVLVHAVLAPKGTVYFSTNHRKFHIDAEALQAMYSLTEISQKTLPEDYRDAKIHRCWRLEKNS